MDKQTKFGITILLTLLFLFACYIDTRRAKQIEDLESELEFTKEELESEKDNNIYLNYRLCELKQNPDADCEQITKDLGLRLHVLNELDKIILK